MTDTGSKPNMKIRCPACGRKLDVSELESFSLHPCPHCQVPFRVPKWYQGILLEDILHQGPGVAVYRALDPTLDREACVKVIQAGEHFQTSHLASFLAATRRAATINHPGVAAVYSCGEVDNEAYAVTQYVRAVDWRDLSDKPAAVRQIAIQALHALLAADDLGHRHGGIKPANLLINSDNHLLITDFGIHEALSKSNVASPYVSPEVAAGDPPSRSADIYSLAVYLYKYATGHLPGEGDLAAWRSGSVPLIPAKEHNPALPVKISEILTQMLSHNPGERPRSYQDILQVFQSEAVSRKSVVLKMSDNQPTQLSDFSKRPAKNRFGQALNVLIVVCLLLLLVVGGLYALSVRRGQSLLNEEGKFEWHRLRGLLRSVLPAKSSHEVSGAANSLSLSSTAAPWSGSSDLPASCWAARPCPPDLNFAANPQANRDYLVLVPEHLREREKERLRILGGSLDYLLTMMRFVGYDRGEDGMIEKRDGSKVRGAIPFASAKGFIVRQRDQMSSDAEPLPLSAFSWPQICDMFAFYAEKRSEMRPDRKQTRQEREETFHEYLRLMILCDWYGDLERAEQYARLAQQASPLLAEQVAHFGLNSNETAKQLE